MLLRGLLPVLGGGEDVPFSNGRSWHKRNFLRKALMLFIFEKCTHLLLWPIPEVGRHTSAKVGTAGGANGHGDCGKAMLYTGG